MRTERRDDFEDRFQRHLAKTGLIPPESKVLVGYSGGADSTCLLHLLVTLGYEVVAAHLHHGQREEAEQEAKLASAFAETLEIPFLLGRADVPRMAEDLGVGLEEAGREARYTFFRQAAFATECNLVATGHTRTDLVETMLLNLVRGSGIAGLAGIPAQRDEIVRPLLPFTRDETREYCEARGFWFHDDPSNVDVSFSRARIRHRVLPELRAVNPSVDVAMHRLSTLAEEEDRFLNGMAAAALEQSEAALNGPLSFLTKDVEIRLGRDQLTSLPPVLFRRAIRLAVGALGAALDHDQTMAVVAGIAAEERGSVTATGGEVALSWDAAHIDLRKLLPTSPFRYPLTIPGETASDEFGWQFTAFESVAVDPHPARVAMLVEISARALKGPLYFRTLEPGDTMRPLGFEGRRKISDLFSEAHLTEAARRRLPIVCDLVGPIWAPGVCLDDRARTQPGERAIRIEFAGL